MFIKAAMSEAVEAIPVPEGEYEVEIVQAEMVVTKAAEANGQTEPNMIRLLVGINSEDHPHAAPIIHNVTLPEGENEVADRLRLRDLRRLCECFGVAFEADGFESEDLVGAKGTCLVTQEEYKNRPQNRLELPPFTTEEEAGTAEKKVAPKATKRAPGRKR